MLSSTRPTRRAAARTLQATAGVAAIALALTACGGSDEPEGGSGDDGPITLKVATFNDFGYTEELLAEYTEEHPNVTVEPITAATSDDARSNLTTKLAAGGEGLADIEAIEVDWLPELMQYPDQFTDLADAELDGRWVDWKVQQATTPEGKVIGYGTDIGPEAICYRSDLFEAAGLPTDREEVAELLGGDDATWEDYFAAGREFVEGVRRPLVRQRRRHLPGHGQPAPRRVRGRGDRRAQGPRDQHRRQGHLRRDHRLGRRRPVGRPDAVGAATGTQRSRRTASPRCSAPAG